MIPMGVFADDIDRLQTKIQSLRNENEALKLRLSGKTNSTIDSLHAELQLIDKQFIDYNTECASLRNELSTLRTTVDALKAQRDELVKSIKTVCESYRGTEWGKAAECIGDAILTKTKEG